jgi:molecular chaperone GrpE
MAAKKIEVEEDREKEPEDEAPKAVADRNSAQDTANPLKAVEEKLAAAEEKAKDHHDRMLRMAAELENYKKRTSRELEDMRKYATENLMRQLLDVVDNLERAIASAPADSAGDQSVVDGVALTLAEITKILEKHSVTPITALGEPFDPAFHQAMSQQESSDQPPNTVVQEFQKGYLMHDRLLRPAMVVVSKAAPEEQPAEKSIDTSA